MTDRKRIVFFIVYAYLFFWLLLAVAGVLIGTGVISGDGLPMQIGVIIGSWTPTLALLALRKKILPGRTLKDFYKDAFKEQLDWKMLTLIAFIQLFIVFCASGITAFTKEVSWSGMFDFSFGTLVFGFIYTLLQGATGEESGWRGFLQPSLEKKFSTVKSSVLVGVIWSFWHTPLWFMSGFSGMELLRYIIMFIVSNISVAIIIGICLKRCSNLLIPVWIHFLFNYFLVPFNAELGDFGGILDIITWMALFYALTAAGYILWNRKNSLRR